ncbi:hypothetical protein B9Z55_009674 [Caenorhabditis nigoni]|uniref:DNA endonuclease activator Ctp1 C-terminal domain-containing protein n=1 Tax=Caenorhabditis nigoni TaxID=1611254 RepID=A0A2G5UT26_9PELO|nr:hypothetical protein B9Z55_009674 [Caenorhabditis nigoni]
MNGGGYYRNSPYYQDPNASFDPFASPQQTQNNYYRNQIDPQSVDVFAVTPRRRSSGESNSISRAIRNALDPEYYVQPSMDVLASTSYDDSSILAAVSSTHSSQEAGSSQPEVASTSQKQKLKKPKPKPDNNGFASIFNNTKTKTHDNGPLLQEDFLSPDNIKRYRLEQRKQRPKQVRMDDFLFKARRVDKGAREFGLHTTHEPKRGSKKKRDSIEMLEVEKADFERVKQKKREEVIEKRKAEVDELDLSLAFGTPSPVRSRHKVSKITKFFDKDAARPSFQSPKRSSNSETYASDSFLNDTYSTPIKETVPETYSTPTSSKIRKGSERITFFDKGPSTSSAALFQSPARKITINDPNSYSSETVLDETLCSTPNRSSLMETVPFPSSSPARSQMTPKRVHPGGRSIIELVKPNPIKRKDSSKEQDMRREPLMQVKRQKCSSSSRKPEFDYPSSPITLTDDEDIKVKQEPLPHRHALRHEQQKRQEFGRHVSAREEMMRQLVDQKFKDERENGGVEARRAELKDGDVIRNKEMRKNLMHGTACKCCRGYYDGLDMDEREKKDYIDKVFSVWKTSDKVHDSIQISRHRYVHQPLPDTPERYWDLTLGPQEEDSVPVMTQERRWESAGRKKEPTGITNWN